MFKMNHYNNREHYVTMKSQELYHDDNMQYCDKQIIDNG
jgi:hypothetical protein